MEAKTIAINPNHDFATDPAPMMAHMIITLEIALVTDISGE
jgi:hypothetical protein